MHVCKFLGCGKTARYVALGLCNGHYDQQLRGKDLTPIKQTAEEYKQAVMRELALMKKSPDNPVWPDNKKAIARRLAAGGTVEEWEWNLIHI